MFKILLTGSSGFIGKAFADEMIKNGHKIIPFDLPDNDILNYDDLLNAIPDADIVFHMAAVADINISQNKIQKNFEINVRGTFNIAKYCAKIGIGLIYCSTCCVYGNTPDDPATEETKPMCMEPYATSKVAGEYIISGIKNLKYMIVRPSTVYGVGMREALFTFIALDRCRRGEKIYIDGDGNQTRQYIYINDVVSGFRFATEKFNENIGQIFNFCGPVPISVKNIISIAADMTGREAIVEFREDRYGQTLRENISIKKSLERFQWFPTTHIRDGMRFTYHNDPRFKNG